MEMEQIDLDLFQRRSVKGAFKDYGDGGDRYRDL
jgi:hypothetical protein